jgi:pimeloyl-ACP methyl ester carboxylesterase
MAELTMQARTRWGRRVRGEQEQEDVQTVMTHLKRDHRVGPIALWGRSMGGVAALLWTAKHPNDVVALVVDSAFASLELLVKVRRVCAAVELIGVGGWR